MTDSVLRIRKTVASDINQIVSVHRRAFAGFYLDKMGSAFLSAYYDCALANAGVISLVAVQKSGSIEGFVVGFKSPKTFYSEFKAAKRRLLLPIIFAIFRHPSIILPSISNFFKISKHSNNKNDEDYTELVSIGVVTNSKGIGSRLLREFIDIANSSGVKEIRLTTNRDHNDIVNKFYLNHGFHRIGIEHRYKRVLNKYSFTNVEGRFGDKR